MITYEETFDKKHVARGAKVFLDGKHVGNIKDDWQGYYYQPKGGRGHGAYFETIEQVKRSLEEDDEEANS